MKAAKLATGILILLWNIICVYCNAGEAGSSSLSNIIDGLLKVYDNRVRPNFGGPPVKVEVNMYILDISSVSESSMDYTMDFYFRQKWKDPRLKFNERPDVKTITARQSVADRIWVPDTFFANSKSSYFHLTTTKNTFMRISPNGEVFCSIRVTVTASCPMNFGKFPMDRQQCSLEIESFGYSTNDIQYSWSDGDKSVGMSPDTVLPQFQIEGHTLTSKTVSLSTGNYSRLAVQIRFARNAGYYIFQIYLPAALIVILSWISFWFDRSATTARILVGVIALLIITTLMSNINSTLPKISYVKSVDLYMGICFIMVFSSLFQYAILCFQEKSKPKKKRHARTEGENNVPDTQLKVDESKGEEKVTGKNAVVNYLKSLMDSNPDNTDRIARIVFPLVFGLFNFFYWII